MTADRAGKLNAVDARNITGVDGAPVAVTRAIRPVERLILGGAVAQTLYIVVTNWNGTTATINVAGTDYDGTAQNENIVVTGNGTYYTTLRYKTTTTTQVTVFTATSFTYTLTQKGWGVIWDNGHGSYKVDCIFNIGDGSTSTYFADTLRSIVFEDLALTYPTGQLVITTGATFRLGVIEDAGDRTTHSGCHLHFAQDASLWNAIRITGSGICYLLSTSMTAEARAIIQMDTATGKWYAWNCIFSKYIEPTNMSGSVNEWSNTRLELGIQCSFNTISPTYVKNLAITKAYYAFTHVHATATVIGIEVQNIVAGSFLMYNTGANENLYLINANVDANVWTGIIWVGVSFLSYLYRQYYCDVHVADKGGIDIQGAVVDCEYAHLVKGSDNKAYKCILDCTAVDATHKPITGTDWATYFEWYSDDGTLGGTWATGFAYKAGTAEWAAGTVTTNAAGNISQQTITYKRYYYSGAALEEGRIHKFTFSKAGYQTLPLDNITVSSAIKWHLELQQPALKRWDGADWVQVGYRRWNGVAWV